MRLRRAASAAQGVTNEMLKLIPPFREQDERLLICATNSVRALDSAFLRHGRFDYVIPVGPPDPAARAAIWDRYLAATPHGDLDMAAIVEESRLFTPADIEFAARRTSQLVFERVLFERGVEEVTTGDILHAIGQTRRTLTPSSSPSSSRTSRTTPGCERRHPAHGDRPRVTGSPPGLSPPIPSTVSPRPGPGPEVPRRFAAGRGLPSRRRGSGRLSGVVTPPARPFCGTQTLLGRLLLIKAADREEAVELARRGTPAKRPRWGATLTTKRDKGDDGSSPRRSPSMRSVEMISAGWPPSTYHRLMAGSAADCVEGLTTPTVCARGVSWSNCACRGARGRAGARPCPGADRRRSGDAPGREGIRSELVIAPAVVRYARLAPGLSYRANSGTSPCAAGLPQPVTGFHPVRPGTR